EIYNSLITYNDEFFVLRDFENYIQAQKKINDLYIDKSHWNKMALINIANSGIFSSDRTIKEYANEIWYKR
ncbi:MAG: glycogen/starch/alpha-glucan phosphorylase, partial [Paraclostridium sp.]